MYYIKLNVSGSFGSCLAFHDDLLRRLRHDAITLNILGYEVVDNYKDYKLESNNPDILSLFEQLTEAFNDVEIEVCYIQEHLTDEDEYGKQHYNNGSLFSSVKTSTHLVIQEIEEDVLNLEFLEFLQENDWEDWLGQFFNDESNDVHHYLMGIDDNTLLDLVKYYDNCSNQANEYGEPEYEAKMGVIFADWNDIPFLFDILEGRGYGCEWSDEWQILDNGKAYRVVGDSWSWTPYYTEYQGSVWGYDEIIEGGELEDYIDVELVNNAERWLSCHIPFEMVEKLGWQMMEEEYSNGFCGGMDNPTDILKKLREEFPSREFVFTCEGVGQFEINFGVMWREEESYQ